MDIKVDSNMANPQMDIGKPDYTNHQNWSHYFFRHKIRGAHEIQSFI